MQQSNNDKKPGLSWSTPTSTPKVQPTKQDTLTNSFNPKESSGKLTARYVGIFVGGLIVGVIFAWGWSSLTHKGQSTVSTANTNATGTAVTTNKAVSSTKTKDAAKVTTTAPSVVATNTNTTDTAALLTVPSPQAAGQSVTIENVEISKPTWVVVYDNNNGTPGNVLGAQLFFTTGSGTVTLLRPTIAGKSYLVGRSIDNGDYRFQKTGDQAVVDANGNLLVTTFTAN